DAPGRREAALALLQDVGHSRRGHGRAARAVAMKIRYYPFETHSCQATLTYPSDRDDELTQAFTRLLDEHLDRSRPVRLIGAGVSNLEARAVQLSLLETRAAERAALDDRLDALRARYGEQAIFRGTSDRPRQNDFRRDDLEHVAAGR